MVQGTEGTVMPCGCEEPKATATLIIESPPFRAGILAIALFFFIAFLSNGLLAQINFSALGITVTVSTFGLLALILLILFFF